MHLQGRLNNETIVASRTRTYYRLENQVQMGYEAAMPALATTPLPPSRPVAFWQQGQAAWPGLGCNETTFWSITDNAVAALAAQNPTLPHPHLDDLNVRDIYLAAAILDGQRGAHEAFDSNFVIPAKSSLTRLGLSAAAVSDALQIVRERLLLPHDGQPPRLGELAGQGDFAALVRVVAVRTGLNLKRNDKRLDYEDVEVFDRLASSHSPQNDLLKKEARDLLKESIRAAVATLAPRDKTLLRLHFFHQLTIDDLGRMYDVHRATTARWLGKIHEQLDKATRAELAKRLQTSSDHLASVLAQAQSSLHSSFHSVWAELAEFSSEALPQPHATR